MPDRLTPDPALRNHPIVHALRTAKRVTVLTGAGVSAESGVPTFRDALTGLWARYRPEELATPEAFAADPERVWTWYAERRRNLAHVEPNPGHRALADLAGLVPDLTLITQNVDELHQQAGSVDVIELHGSIHRVRCSVDGLHTLPHAAPDRTGDDGGAPPTCPQCGAPCRPDVVWFGELLPEDALARAFAEAGRCDVFLSVGTSNAVYPAAGLPWIAADRGVPVGIVNPDMADQRTGPNIHPLTGAAGTVLPAIVNALREG